MRPSHPSALACLGLLLGATAAAGAPKLVRIDPPGGQRGTTVEVDFVGRHLERQQGLLFYEPGIAVESIEAAKVAPNPNGGKPLPVEPGLRVRARLRLAADCALGAHGVRLRTATGLTEYHRFFVGPFPTVDEGETRLERNDTRETAKAVPLNCTVHGKMNDPSDIDLYRVEVKRGQRLSAEIEAARIGVERGIPDLHLAFFDADGKELAAADDSALFVQDPVLSVLAERDGAHYVEVRHSMYNAAGEAYRLHVGTFPRPTAVYPAGGPAGSELKGQILGDPRGAWSQTVRLPSTPGYAPFIAVDPADGVSAPSPNRLRASPFPNVLEVEPNDAPESLPAASAVDLPVAFNGIIGRPGDVDCFRFRARKGERFTFRTYAAALGSPADPLIWVKAVGGKANAAAQRATDARAAQIGLPPANGLNRETNDPVLEFAAPADGEYVLGVEDKRGAGGPDYVYRVEARPEENAVYAYVAPEPDNQFQPQHRQAIAVAAGNRCTVQIGFFATNRPFDGELELVAVNLPEGVTLHAPPLAPGATRIPVVFEAAASAKPQAALIDLVLRHPGRTEALKSGYRQVILMNGYGNNDFYLHVPIAKLAVAVTEPAPFSVEVDEPKSALVQNGEMALKFKVRRAAGYDGAVTVYMEAKPSGLSTATPVTVPGNGAEGSYVIGASRGAAAGAHRVVLTAVSGGGRVGYRDTGDRTYVSSQPFRLTVAEPHVEAKIARTSVERGKTGTLVCKLTHLQAFHGTARATLARLPRGVELVEPTREITSADREVSFPIRATGEALVGNYQGIVLDLTVTENGQAVRQLSGSGMLRVDAERGAPAKAK